MRDIGDSSRDSGHLFSDCSLVYLRFITINFEAFLTIASETSHPTSSKYPNRSSLIQLILTHLSLPLLPQYYLAISASCDDVTRVSHYYSAEILLVMRSLKSDGSEERRIVADVCGGVSSRHVIGRGDEVNLVSSRGEG